MKTVLTLYLSKLDSATTHYDKGGVRRTETSHWFSPYVYRNDIFERIKDFCFRLGGNEIKEGRRMGIILCSEKGVMLMEKTKKSIWVCLRLNKRGWK